MPKYSNANIDDFAEIFKALSNPNRLKIFLRLASCCKHKTVNNSEEESAPEENSCVGKLGCDLGIVPSTISHHVKELKRSKLISMKRCGQKMECSANPKILTALKDFFSKY